MNPSITRRSWLRSTAAASAALTLPSVTRNVLGANEKLNIAGIGAGGKGSVDIGLCGTEHFVALCDVDERNASRTFKQFPNARKYKDYRVMLEKEQKHIDAVTVSTPDHHHGVASALALTMGKHVYCQKPLTHCVFEARVLTELARKHKVVTQMGNQGHAHPGTRRMVEIIRAGVLGTVREVHVWTDRPIWPQGIDRPKGTPAVPPHLDWDLWLGPAPQRPYHSAYVPFKWRGFWDFGTGALGDMGCHNMDTPFFALNLRDPSAVSATTSGVNPETAPSWSIIKYEFPELDGRAAVDMTWYDGGKKPDPQLVKRKDLPGNGVIMIGSKDTLYIPSYWGAGQLISGTPISDLDSAIPQSLPRLANGADNDRAHHQEWVAACKGQGQAMSNFDYAGPMTEAVLLGNVAMRLGETGGRVEWDAKAMKVTNHAQANQYIRDSYRQGWSLGVEELALR